MSILSKQWKGEDVKIRIHFDSDTVYEATSNGTADKCIKSFSKSKEDSYGGKTPLGQMTSTSVSITLYDNSGSLSPSNTASPYYGLMKPGVKVEAFIADDDSESGWSPYGLFFVQDWNGAYSMGGYSDVSLYCSGILDLIGNLELPLCRAYGDMTLQDSIDGVLESVPELTELGVTITVDNSIKTKKTFGVITGDTVADFLNGILQITNSRAVEGTGEDILIIPALECKDNYNTIEISGEDFGDINAVENKDIDYKSIEVSYIEQQSKTEAVLLNQEVSLAEGENILPVYEFTRKCLDVRQVSISGVRASDVQFDAYQNGIQITITSPIDVEEAEIEVIGACAITENKSVKIEFDASSLGGVYRYNTRQLMDETDAQNIANAIKDYFGTIKTTYSIGDTILTPLIDIGDLIIISDTDTPFDGSYRICSVSIEFGEAYNCALVLSKVPEEQEVA